MTRKKYTEWLVLCTDARGGESHTMQFTDNRRARLVVSLLRRRNPHRYYSDPVRVSVLLPEAKP